MQQTFLSAQRALVNGSSPREPAAWLATIARNECLARVRERMREPLPVDAEPTDFGADAYSAAVSRYEVATLREALADLPRAQREAILLRELRGLSYDEVARALSVTTGRRRVAHLPRAADAAGEAQRGAAGALAHRAVRPPVR